MSNIDTYDLRFMLDEAARMLGRPYKLGGKWKQDDPEPTGPIDCSGFTRWVYSRGGITIPEGSTAQFRSFCLTMEPALGDLGFFIHDDGAVHHVGMLFSLDNVIEARGQPYNAVILRPRAKWEAFNEFSGWYTYQE